MSDLEERLRTALRDVADAGPWAPVELPLAPVRSRRPTRLIAVVSAAAVAATAVVALAVVERSTRDESAPPVGPAASAHDPASSRHSSGPSLLGPPVTLISGNAAQFGENCPTAAEYGLTFTDDVALSGSTRSLSDVADAAYQVVPDRPPDGEVRVGRLDVRLRTLSNQQGEAVRDPLWVVQWPLSDVPSSTTDAPIELSRTVVLAADLTLVRSYVCYQATPDGDSSNDVPPLVAGETYASGQAGDWIGSGERSAISRAVALATVRKIDGRPTEAPTLSVLAHYTQWGQPTPPNHLVWLFRFSVQLAGSGPARPPSDSPASGPALCSGTETIAIDASSGIVLHGIEEDCGGQLYVGRPDH